MTETRYKYQQCGNPYEQKEPSECNSNQLLHICWSLWGFCDGEVFVSIATWCEFLIKDVFCRNSGVCYIVIYIKERKQIPHLISSFGVVFHLFQLVRVHVVSSNLIWAYKKKKPTWLQMFKDLSFRHWLIIVPPHLGKTWCHEALVLCMVFIFVQNGW